MTSYHPTNLVHVARAYNFIRRNGDPNTYYARVHAEFMGLAVVLQRIVYRASEALEPLIDTATPRGRSTDAKRGLMVSAIENYISRLCDTSSEGADYMRDFTEYVYRQLMEPIGVFEAHIMLAHRGCGIENPRATSLLTFIQRLVYDIRKNWNRTSRDFDSAGLQAPTIIPNAFEWLDMVDVKATELKRHLQDGKYMHGPMDVGNVFRAYSELLHQALDFDLYVDALRYAQKQNKKDNV